MRSSYKAIGDFIKPVKIKNSDLEAEELLGINIDKYFMPSVANVVGTDLSKYKVVRNGQFACNRMHVGRDYRIPIALSNREKPFIVSPAYDVFEIYRKDELLDEYLMMWFSRPEFDRNAWFHTDADVRGGLPWTMFCSLELPVPSIEKQREIVKEYNTVVNRIKLNEQLNQKLEETAQALYKHWFVDFEFPHSPPLEGSPQEGVGIGKPYKSSGGKMVYNEELEKEIPEEWEVGLISDLFILQRGHDLPTQDRIKGDYPIFASTGIAEFHNDFKIDIPTIITGRSGSLGELFYYDQPCWPLNTTLYAKEFKAATPLYALYYLQTINLKEMGSGSAVPTLNRNDIHSLSCELPESRIMSLFDFKASIINSNIQSCKSQIEKLQEFNKILLSKMTQVEVEEKEVVGG